MWFLRLALLVVTVGFVISPTECWASNWVNVGGNSGVSVFIDKQSLRRNGAKVKVWSKWEYSEPRDVKNAYPRQTYQATKDLSIYNCSERTSITIQSTKYGTLEMSAVVEDLSAPDVPSRYSEVAPDTIGETILEFACQETASTKSK